MYSRIGEKWLFFSFKKVGLIPYNRIILKDNVKQLSQLQIPQGLGKWRK